MRSIVDTHCHLDLNHFDDDRDAVVARALEAGVHAMILIGYNPDRWRTTADLCARWPFMVRAVGIHPNDASLWSAVTRQQLVREIETSHPVAIGEIGLDFFRSAENRTQQVEAFEQQLEIAAAFNLPVVIHQRAAENDVIEILERHRPPKGVMHCFTGDRVFADRCEAIGFHLGIGGVLTFPRSDDVRDAVASVEHESLLLETDAPFLAPQIRRGKRNEPAFLSSIAHELAQVTGCTEDHLREQTTRNAIALFGDPLKQAIQAGTENA